MAQTTSSSKTPAPITALPEGNYVTTRDGHRIHYWDEGESKSPPLVFLHGSGPGASGYSNFKTNYPELLKSGYRVVLVDHIGYGRSDKPTDATYHLDFFVGVLMDVLEHLGITSFVPIGNSLGGAIAIKMALDYPQRVSKMILLAPGGIEEKEHYFTMPGIQAMGRFFTSLADPDAPAPDAPGLRSVLEELVFDPKYVTAELVEERLQVFRHQHAGVMTTMQVPNMKERLGEIQCPVLAFWGANERFMPLGGALTLASGCTHSSVILRSECGHWYMVEYSADFNHHCATFLAAKQ